MFDFPDLIVHTVPDTQGSLSLEVEGIQTFGNGIDFFDEDFRLQFDAR